MKYKESEILVTGGSGMVGKSLQKLLPSAIYLSSNHYDLTIERDVIEVIEDYKPKVIIHLAAKVGGIIDNINRPAEYFTDNILMNSLLIDHSYKSGIKRFIGILSSCIYPDVMDHYPMSESDMHLGPPTPTNFSYAYAKRCMAVQIDAYNKQYNTKYQYLTPCNLYGEHDKFDDSKSHFIAALIKKIIEAKETKSDKITLYGTGKPLRQFIHSDDLASIIHKCLENDVYENMNIATDDTLSIHQMAEIALSACGMEHLKIEYEPSYPDGQFRKDISTDKLKKHFPDFEYTKLYNGIKRTYDKISSRHDR